ncbi:acyl-CoA synthetase [Natrinema caseinilyticum]|uniref:acyl-CoA synthetase n=1 Tax=Natrinema caseinilyticum TaxID=2961570 RepID=UPI0020C2BCC0|nr:AMP-binding protein [Natrinema caseinilyticum]
MGRYQEIRKSFKWDQVWDTYRGDKECWFNIGYEAVGKHADSNRRDKIAVRVVDFADGGAEEMTYGELDQAAGRMINFLHDLGLSEGDRIATMLEPCSELYTTTVAAWLGGFELVPLSPLFGPDAANYRIREAGVEAVVTSPKRREKIDVESIKHLNHMLTAGDPTDLTANDDCPFSEYAAYDPEYQVVKTDPDDTCTIQYTSGTTGPPKGVMAKHAIIVSMYPGFTWAADHRPEHEYFGAGPPAWSYGLFGCTAFALSKGMGTIAYRGKFEPQPFVDVLETYGITNVFAPPTLLRQLSQSDVDFDALDLDVELVATAGEPLDSNTIEWAQGTLDATIVDHYGFTEGAMAINNYSFDDWEIKPGSMGKPAPGFDVRVLDRDEDIEVERNEVGEIAIRTEDACLNATGYLDMPEKTEETWGGKWIRTDDLGRVDEDGYFWFEGRADDVILSAGHRIGPTEVENTLLTHDAISEAGVVGLPDQERGEIVAAFIVLTDNYEASNELKEEVQKFVREELAKTKYPRKITFMDDLPKTNSGKIRRKELRER